MTSKKRDTVSHNTWNKVSQPYADKFMPLTLYNATYDAFIDAISSKERPMVLEIGCGPGNCTKYLLDKHPNLKITAIDSSENMLALARKYNPTVTFFRQDGREIAHFTSKYDGVFCGFFIPYISSEELSKFLNDTYALLQPNGILYLSFVAGDPKDSGYISNANGDQMYFYYHDKNAVLYLLEHQGFQLLLDQQLTYTDTTNQSQLHDILLLSKKG